MTRHQYGISAFVSQTSFRGETSGDVAKCRLFSQARVSRDHKNGNVFKSNQVYRVNNLVPRAFPSKNGWGAHFLREKPWGRGCRVKCHLENWLLCVPQENFQLRPYLRTSSVRNGYIQTPCVTVLSCSTVTDKGPPIRSISCFSFVMVY